MGTSLDDVISCFVAFHVEKCGDFLETGGYGQRCNAGRGGVPATPLLITACANGGVLLFVFSGTVCVVLPVLLGKKCIMIPENKDTTFRIKILANRCERD